MFTSTLITLREGLEAALIVGIILSLLGRLGQQDRRKSVWAGVVVAVIVSLIAGLALNALGLAFEGRGEEIFEGLIMIVAAGVLTWMIFWMQSRARTIRASLESDVHEAVSVGTGWALFSLAFVAVLREGIETALFLTATMLSTSPAQALAGGLLGLVIAIALGWLIFAVGKQLNVRVFFQVTGVVLVLFAAGLIAHGIHELQEAALFPIAIEHIWDINHVVDENSTIGQLLKALFGYNSNPSLLESIAYGTYIVVVGVVAWLISRPRQIAEYAAQ